MTALPPDVVADLEQENARLQAELRTARDRQTASAEILRTIASAPGDAERSLRQIAETTARLFDCQSVRIRLAENGEWGRTISVGATAERVGAEVSVAQLRIGGNSLPGTVLHENRQIHIPDLDNTDPAMADWPGLPPARAAGTRVIAGTPLRREGKAIGVLIVYRDRPEPFTAEELALLQSFADQAVIAIENARLFNETREALERQTATADILKVIASSPSDVQPVFEAIATSSNKLIGGFSTAVLRFVGDELHLAAFTPTSLTADAALKASFPSPISEFPPFLLVRSGETAQIIDTEAEDVPPVNRKLARLRGYRSMLFTPLMSGGTPIGLISVTRKEPGKFAAHHIELVRTFADQAVIAIENVRLFDEVQAKTHDLTEALTYQTGSGNILKVIASSPTDVGPVLKAIVENACELCESDDAVVHLREGDDLCFAAQHGSIPVGLQNRAINRTFVTGRSVVDKVPIHLHDVLSAEGAEFPDAQEMSRRVGARTLLSVPLLREGEAIGTIVLRRTEVRPFSDRQIALLQTFADQAVIAIGNVRLFDEVQARTEDLRESLQQQTATADVLKVISRSAFDLDSVLDTLVESAARLSEAENGIIARQIGSGFQAVAGYGHPPERWATIRSFPILAGRGTFVGRAIAEGRTVHVPDVLADPEFEGGIMQQAVGYRSVLCVPLLREGVPIGVIGLARNSVRPFTGKQIELVSTFADQAVIAIENVRLFDEVQARTRELAETLEYQTATSEVLNVISRSPNNLQPVMDTIVQTAQRLCASEYALILQRDGAGFYRIIGHANARREFLIWLEENPVSEGDGSAVAIAAAEKRTIHLPDALADPRFTDLRRQRLSKARTMLAVPLMREAEVIGVVFLARTEIRPFTDKQVELVTSFADQAVIAISNVGLFEQVQERTRELSQSLDELRTAQDRLVQTEKLASLGQLTAGIAHEIKNPLNFVNNFAALSAELTDELNDALKSAALGEKLREEVDELTQTLKDNLQKVVQHGKRADSIVKNMLLHSREGSGDHRPADINALLDESLNLAYHGARAEKREFNVTLQRDFDAMAGTIEVFPQEITRVFLNLISNGFYAVTKRKTENGGSGFEPVLVATTRDLGDTVEIRIRDNGTGIPDEVKEKMFNPFFTTKPAGEGTGLGLSMSHDIIVKQHGGKIDVETAPGEFTEFTIVLPRISNFSNKNRG